MEPPNPGDLAPDPSQDSGAHFGGESDEYRYLLWRTWDTSRPRLLWVLLNPSRADAQQPDPTLTRCIGFSRTWGYGGLEIVNLFALCSTNSAVLSTHSDPIGPENDRYIAAAAARAEKRIVVAWGEKGVLCGRGPAVLRLLKQHATVPLFHLGMAQNGSPLHPLYLSGGTKPEPFQAAQPEGHVPAPAESADRKENFGMTVPEVLALLGQVEREMKAYDFGVSMAQRKLNSSFALLGVQALRRYLLGEQDEAAADFATLADELRSRGHGQG